MRPLVNNLLLCDYLSFDGQKASCCGIFQNVHAPVFPYPFNFFIYSDLSGGKGKCDITTEVRHVFNGMLLGSAHSTIFFKDALRGLTIMLNFKVIFEFSGQYSVNLLANKELLRSSKLEVCDATTEEDSRSSSYTQV
jgi:hypothetical protein